MANRTFLVSTDGPYASIPPSSGFDAAILVAASYMIPVCWFSLFSPSCLTPRSVPADDGSTIDYLVLQTPKEEALVRLKDFRARARRSIPLLATSQFDSYETFLGQSRGAWLAVETVELWMMDDPPQMERSFRECLDATSNVGRWSAVLHSAIARRWHALLAQADIDLKTEKRIELHSLFGYSWIKPVPWEAKEIAGR